MFDKSIRKQLDEMSRMAWDVHSMATQFNNNNMPVTHENLLLLMDRAHKIINHIEAVSAQMAEIKSKIG